MKKQSTASSLLPTADLSEDARSFGRSRANIPQTNCLDRFLTGITGPVTFEETGVAVGRRPPAPAFIEVTAAD